MSKVFVWLARHANFHQGELQIIGPTGAVFRAAGTTRLGAAMGWILPRSRWTMYEAAGAMGMVWASRPVTIIGERIARESYDFLDGRDTVVIGRFGLQLREHGIDQHLAAAFKALPFDFLNGIVEFKRRKDGLEIGLSD